MQDIVKVNWFWALNDIIILYIHFLIYSFFFFPFLEYNGRIEVWTYDLMQTPQAPHH